MNFGVIGPGDIGEVIIRKLGDAGYPVKMANARGPESLKDLAANTGAIPVSVEQVVQDVDMLFIVVPQKSIPGLPKGLLNKAKKETIAESWRQQPGSPVYCTNPTKEELRLWLKKVDRSSLATDREKALKAFYPTRDADYQAQIEAHRSVLINEQNNK